ncbi:MAG: organoarsenical effux MFS transporter ArsJ [Pseudomonadota bacterium]
MKHYAIITAAYWAFTLTDGALRMLVVLYFHQLGYGPLAIASLFVFYEFFGIVTNLGGGWLAARLGLTTTLIAGLYLQVVALGMLLVDPAWLSVVWVMAAQALSGIAKDLTKTSAKSGIKVAVPEHADGQLYRLVTLLTGSKNALKGVGFFLGGALLGAFGFRPAVGVLLGLIIITLPVAAFGLGRQFGKASFKPKFDDLISKSAALNRLSAARLFLFGARDTWFVVALPVYLQLERGWSPGAVSTFLAVWIIGYGIVQSQTPRLTARRSPDGATALGWGFALAFSLAGIVIALAAGADPDVTLSVGLLAFGVLFAVNSGVHSYLIVAYAERDGVSLDVGFYYMANAAGRLAGTLLSGWIYQAAGLSACLVTAMAFVLVAAATARLLPTSASTA